MQRLATLLLLVALGAAPGLGCGGGGDGPSVAEGVVRGVDAPNGKVTLEHGDIPGLMKAMTMTFDVAEGAQLEGLAEGDRVTFEVEHAGGRYTVTSIARKP